MKAERPYLNGVARAMNDRLLPHRVILNILNMLKKYDQIPLDVFGFSYKALHNEVLDCHLACNGLRGLLESIGDIIDLQADGGGGLIVSLREKKKEDTKQVLTIVKRKTAAGQLSRIFRANPNLGAGAEFLHCIQPFVEKSPYEIATELHADRVKLQVKRIKQALALYPSGLDLMELCRIASIDLKLFNISTNYNDLTQELPEVFYRTNQCGKILLFDASESTVGDLTGTDDSVFLGVPPSSIVSKAIAYKIYQMTLYLVKECGVAGLKLNVWRNSLLRNYKEHLSGLALSFVMDYGPLQYFSALARYDLIDLHSPRACRNDLRARLPSQVERCNRSIESFSSEILDDDDDDELSGASTISSGLTCATREP